MSLGGVAPTDAVGYNFMEVYGNATSGGGYRAFTSAGGIDIRMQATGSQGYLGVYSPNPLVFVQNNVERFRLDGTYINVSNQDYLQNRTDGNPSVMNIGSITNTSYAPGRIAFNRYNATSTNTPDNVAVGEIRFDGLNTASGYNNMGMIQVVSGVNTPTGAPAYMAFSVSSSGASATERMRIAPDGSVTLGGALGSQSLKVNQTTGSTRWVEITGSVAGSPIIKSSGGALQLQDGTTQVTIPAESGAAVALDLKGRSGDSAAVMRFMNNAYTFPSASLTVFPGDGFYIGTSSTVNDTSNQVKVAHIANAVNLLQLQGSGTGGGPYLGAVSATDTNVALGIYSKGTGAISLYTRGAASEELRITNSGVNSTRYVTITGSNAADPTIGTSAGALKLTGGDGNINVVGTFNAAQVMTSGNGVSTGDVVFEHGNSRTGDGNVYMDFHATPATDYESRVLRLGGANGEFSFANRGFGNMVFDQQQAGNTLFKTNSVERMRIESLGGVRITGTAYSPTITLTDGTYITWDTSLGNVAQITVGGNRTMNAATNLVNGGFYALAVIQNTGANTVTWNTTFKWAAQTAPTLSTAAGAKDFFVFRSDGTNLYEQGRSLGAY